MSKATKPAAENAAAKRKLTRAEKREIEAIICKYKGDGKPHTAQDTIPYQTMHPDGICHLGGRSYSKSIEFFDVNYQLAQSFEIPLCGDGLDHIRQENTGILKRQLERGNNGNVKTKYLTYTIAADNPTAARARPRRIETELKGNIKGRECGAKA